MTHAIQIPAIELNDGAKIPQLGFGVFQVPPQDTERAVSEALEAGYRHIDTAAAYRNEAGVGRAIAASGLAREEIFVTTKLWNSEHGRGRTRDAFAQSMERLGLDVLDLYLIHWPVAGQDRYVETWQTFAELRAQGRIRSIGVSNFHTAHLQRLAAETGVVPAIDQIELHPYLQQAELRRYHAEHGIVTEAWSPLAQGGELLDDPTITRIAEGHGVAPAQVVLRWHIELGNVVIPKSVTPARIRSNIDVFGFALDAHDHEAIAALNRDARVGPDPDTFAGG